MKTIVIFAGLSTRFWPLKEKCFWHISGKTILEHQIDRLREGGCKDLILVGGKHNLMLAKKLKLKNVQFVEQKDDSLGMREAFLSALPICKKEPVLLVNSNDLIEPRAYKAILLKMNEKKIDGVLLAKKVKQYFPGGYLTVKNKRITSIVEKPGAGNEPSDMVNIVAHGHKNAALLLQTLKKIETKKDDGYEQALDRLFKAGHYEALPYSGQWQAIKYPWHLLNILPLILPTGTKPIIPKSATIHKSAVIEGAVVLGEKVRVLAHATIIGPCFIGDNTIVANNALVRSSSIGNNCVIGYCTEVVRSVLADNVWTHMSYVGDSVIDANTSLGGGTALGNLRLDEGEIHSHIKGEPTPTGLTKFGAILGANIRTGIHCCISPGVKIGADSFLASNITVSQDIPDNSFVKIKQELDIRPNAKHASSPDQRENFKKKV